MRVEIGWPAGEPLRKAVRWLAEQERPHTAQQVEEAASRFDLSPADEAFLLRHFVETTVDR